MYIFRSISDLFQHDRDNRVSSHCQRNFRKLRIMGGKCALYKMRQVFDYFDKLSQIKASLKTSSTNGTRAKVAQNIRHFPLQIEHTNPKCKLFHAATMTEVLCPHLSIVLSIHSFGYCNI